jgi:hypothetical protein
MSVMNYHYLLRSSPEERISHPLLGGSSKSRYDLRTLYGLVQVWVLKVVTVNAAGPLDVTPCFLVGICQRFAGMCCLHLHDFHFKQLTVLAGFLHRSVPQIPHSSTSQMAGRS